MKKIIFCLLTFIITGFIFAQDINKYSKEIGIDYPLTYNPNNFNKQSKRNIDLLQYKTIIRNGLIEELENLSLNDLCLGALSNTELKLLRNMYYAKKGYVFNDVELTSYYKQFSWYKPKNKNVNFTDSENYAINKIKLFESDSTVSYSFENQTVTWEVFMGGADQRGALLKLKNDKTFIYTPSQTINRITNIEGTWSISNNKIVLKVLKENVIFGGYIMDHPNTPYMDKGNSVTIIYNEPVNIMLPLNESEIYKQYKFSFADKWLKIGSEDCFITK